MPVSTQSGTTVAIDNALDELKNTYPDLRAVRGAKRNMIKEARVHLEQAKKLLKQCESI